MLGVRIENGDKTAMAGKKEQVVEAGKNTRFSSQRQPDNPGRKLGVPTTATRLRRFLEVEYYDENPVTREFEMLTIAEKMDLVQLKKALAGDIYAYKEILDRLEGRSLQRTENEHNLGEQTAQTILKISFRPPEDEQPIASSVQQKPKGARKKV